MYMNNEIITQLIGMLVSNSNQANNTTTVNAYPIGQKILLRGYYAGVLFGELVSVKDGVYRMKNTRRLYYWKASKGITLEDVAIYWITDKSKVTSTVPLCDVTDQNISMLIPCSDMAIKSIESAPEYKPS